MKPEMGVGEVPGTIYGLVEKGWMTHKSSSSCGLIGIFCAMHQQPDQFYSFSMGILLIIVQKLSN